MTHISYKTAKALKDFLQESAPEPIDGIYIKVGVCSNGPSYPRYALHDLLSKPFCEAFEAKVEWRWPASLPIYEKLCDEYYESGLPAVEAELMRMMGNEDKQYDD